MTKQSVAIFQTYVPSYRELFFTRLIDSLEGLGIGCDILAGSPPQAMGQRGDSVRPPWLIWHQPRYFNVKFKQIPYYGAWRAARGYTAVIVSLEGTSPDVYELLLRRRNGQRLGLWGHVGSYVKPPNKLDLAAEGWAMRRADAVFAYTPGGARAARAAGVHRDRVTSVMNTVDTESLEQALINMTDERSERFRRDHGLIAGRTLGFVGALDAPKRIAFLAEALDVMWTIDPLARLVVGGRGSDEPLLHAAAQRGQVIMLGYAGPAEKALIASVASALVMPGRIGLIAVEALAMGLPIVTTTWRYHAPEVEYLTEGVTVHTSADNPESFALRALEAMLLKSERQESLAWRFPRLSDMVGNFTNGVAAMLDPAH
jgi:glycosyltransferase involved in cell wall biosynthesis